MLNPCWQILLQLAYLFMILVILHNMLRCKMKSSTNQLHYIRLRVCGMMALLGLQTRGTLLDWALPSCLVNEVLTGVGPAKQRGMGMARDSESSGCNWNSKSLLLLYI